MHDKKDRIRRALAERKNRHLQDSDDGQRPLERFPKLREALMKQRQGGEGGEQARGGGRFKGRRGGRGGGRDSDAVFFPRRYIDMDKPAVTDDEDIDASLQRLWNRAEELKTELSEIMEETERLQQLKQEQEAGSDNAGNEQSPDT